jgi:large subunit ribosomal protein L24
MNENKKMHIKTGDTVIVVSGKYANGKEPKIGKVIGVSPKEGKVIVEGRNMVKKHVKPRKMGDPSGIVESAGAMYASKVMVICPHCNKPARVGHKKFADGTKSRICKRCGETL